MVTMNRSMENLEKSY